MKAIVKEPGELIPHLEEIANLDAARARVCGAVGESAVRLVASDLVIICDAGNNSADNYFWGWAFGGPVVLLGREKTARGWMVRDIPPDVEQSLLGR